MGIIGGKQKVILLILFILFMNVEFAEAKLELAKNSLLRKQTMPSSMEKKLSKRKISKDKFDRAAESINKANLPGVKAKTVIFENQSLTPKQEESLRKLRESLKKK